MRPLPKFISQELAFDIVCNRGEHLEAVNKMQEAANTQSFNQAKLDTLAAWQTLLNSPEKVRALEAFGLGIGLDVENRVDKVWANAFDSKHPIPVERLAEGKFSPISRVQITTDQGKSQISPEELIKLSNNEQHPYLALKGADEDRFKQALPAYKLFRSVEDGPIKMMLAKHPLPNGKTPAALNRKFINHEDGPLYVNKGEVQEACVVYSCDDEQQLYHNPQYGKFALVDEGDKPTQWSATPQEALTQKRESDLALSLTQSQSAPKEDSVERRPSLRR